MISYDDDLYEESLTGNLHFRLSYVINFETFAITASPILKGGLPLSMQ